MKAVVAQLNKEVNLIPCISPIPTTIGRKDQDKDYYHWKGVYNGRVHWFRHCDIRSFKFATEDFEI